MELFNLLKNKAGKLVMGGTQVAVLTVGAAGLFSSAMFKVGESIGEKELAVRPLSSVSSSYAYEGLNRKSDGMLSSMNIQNRGVAVGADRERLEGNSSKNDFGLSAADNLGRRVSVPGTGSAAATSATDGLGSGGVDMVEINYGASSSRASVPGVNPGAVSQGAYGGARQAGDPTAGAGTSGTLASASMARASGNAFNAASGAVGTSSSAASGRGGVSSRASGSDGYNFSGSMPSGSNVVSAYNGLNGSRMSGSSFMAGGRNATVGRRGGSANGKDDLKRISRMSALLADSTGNAAAAGARPFLADSITSAGMSIDSEAAAGASTGSADFETPESRNLRAIGDWGQQVQDDSNARGNARTRLIWLLIGSIAATLLAIPLGYNLINKAGIWSKIAGLAIIAAAITVCAFAIAQAGIYAHKFTGGFLPMLVGIIGGIGIACLGLTVAAAFSGQESKLHKFANDIIPALKKGALKAGKNIGTSTVVSTGTQEISKAVNKDKN